MCMHKCMYVFLCMYAYMDISVYTYEMYVYMHTCACMYVSVYILGVSV